MTVSPNPKSMANNGYPRLVTSRVRTQIHTVSTAPPGEPDEPPRVIAAHTDTLANAMSRSIKPRATSGAG